MKSVNMHDAKTHLSQLVSQVGHGESFIIAKAGKPVARLSPVDAVAPGSQSRTGFLVGRIDVPSDFDRMGDEEIAQMFSGE